MNYPLNALSFFLRFDKKKRTNKQTNKPKKKQQQTNKLTNQKKNNNKQTNTSRVVLHYLSWYLITANFP